MEKLKCKIVMLVSNTASNIRLSGQTGGLEYHKTPAVRLPESYHLYFTSNREIKEGDFVFDKTDNFVLQINNVTFFEKADLTLYNKIEATTDPSLELPLIPQSFITKFVELQGKIDEVMIDMINIPNFKVMEYSYKPKLRSDNTVIVSKVKDTWTRDEVVALIQKYNTDFKVFEDNEEWLNNNL